MAVPHATINYLARGVHEHTRESGLPTLDSGNITGCSHYRWASSSHKNGCATAIDAGVAPSPCF